MWGGNEKLDKNEKFLKNYIMNKGWIDNEDVSYDSNAESEDASQEDKNDRFEETFNFRYQEDGAD